MVRLNEVKVEAAVGRVCRGCEPAAKADAEYEALVAHYVEWLPAKHGYDGAGCAENLERLAGYMAAYRLGKARKGLLLAGQCGRGKSMAMRIFSRWAAVPMISAQALAHAYQEDRAGTLRVFGRPMPVWVGGTRLVPDLIVDDLGAEATKRIYGEVAEVLAEVINARDELFVEHGAKLHVTCNLGPKELKAQYGDRTLSRILGLCNWVELGGPDRRVER